MAPNALGPYYCQINYHSVKAPHTMTIPTKTWNPGSGGGTFDIWSGGTVAATAMVTDLVDKMLPLYNADVQFDNYIIFKQLLPSDDPQPVYNASWVGKIGTTVSSDWFLAIEKTFISRSTTFGIAKLTLLDSLSGDNFIPRLAMNVDEDALWVEWANDAKGWCARDNGQINTFLKITVNLNQKLRKEYRFT